MVAAIVAGAVVVKVARKNFSTQVVDWVRTLLAVLVAASILVTGAAGAWYLAVQIGVIVP